MNLAAQCRRGCHRLHFYAQRNVARAVAALAVGDLAGALAWLQRARSNIDRAAALRLAAVATTRSPSNG